MQPQNDNTQFISPYALGRVEPDAVRPLLQAKYRTPYFQSDLGGGEIVWENSLPRWPDGTLAGEFEKIADAPRYAVVPIDSPLLEHDNMFAVYGDTGEVQRAFTVWFNDEKETVYAPAGDLTYPVEQSISKVLSESEVAALGIDTKQIGERDDAAKNFSTAQGNFTAQRVRRPKAAHGQDFDTVLSQFVGYSLQAVMSLILGGGTQGAAIVAGAQAVTGEKINDAAIPLPNQVHAVPTGLFTDAQTWKDWIAALNPPRASENTGPGATPRKEQQDNSFLIFGALALVAIFVFFKTRG